MEDRTSEPGPKSSIPTSAMTSVRIPTLVLLAIAVVLVDHAEANCANSLDQRMARYKDGFAKCLGQKTVCFFFTQEGMSLHLQIKMLYGGPQIESFSVVLPS